MQRGMGEIVAAGLGAGMMYLFDPAGGRRRRAIARDRLGSSVTRMGEIADVTARNLRDKTKGLAAEMSARARGGGAAADDRLLVARIRSKLGRYVSHPRSIAVKADGGRVVLEGEILSEELGRTLRAVRSVRGVVSLENKLGAHSKPDIPSLQGGRPRRGERHAFGQTNWDPATRAVAGAAGCALIAIGLRQSDLLRIPLVAAGGSVLARAVTNTDLGRLVGLRGGRAAVTTRKVIAINAPRDEVYRFWSSYANFPRFMSHVSEVRDLGNGRSRWVVKGPGGVSLSWEAVTTSVVPHEIIAWRSEPGSIVPNAGIVRFDSIDGERTRLTITFSYTPPAGVLGHVAAHVFGSDAKSVLDEELLRMKSLIEEGKTTAHGRETMLSDLGESAWR